MTEASTRPLAPRKSFMKEEDGKHHDDARRGIEQNGRDRQRRQFDGCKIADIEEDDAPQAGPQEHPGIAPGNAQSLRIPAEDEASHDDSRHQGTAKSNLQRRQSIRRQLAGKQADDAPADTRCDDAKRRHTFYFHLYHLLKKIGLAKDKRLRSSPGFIIAQSQQLMI